MAEVVLKDVSKIYPTGCHAVAGLNLDIADGELLVLAGPSGAGKTTVLRLIAGLETATTGTIRIGGRDVTSLPPYQRNVSLVAQRPALYPYLSVRGNLLQGDKLRSGNIFLRWCRRLFSPGFRNLEDQVWQNSEVLAGKLGLSEKIDSLPGQLSGGQQQRLALGRALISQAAVLLLDEPLSHLDPPLKAELRRELHLLHDQFPATILLITHDPGEALALGDRVAFMDGGALRQVGRPQEIWESPSHRRVAEWFFRLSCLEGQLTSADGNAILRTRGATWPVPLAWASWQNRIVTLCLRPENIRISLAGPGQAMDVQFLEPLGRDFLVTCRGGEATLTGLTGCRENMQVGRKVMVQADASSGLLFDGMTGVALDAARAAG